MGENSRIPLADAERLAAEAVGLLADSCERIEVAGSIRRRRADVGDVEIVAIPRVEHRQADFFGDHLLSVDLLDARCRELLEAGTFEHRLDKNGHNAFGAKFKRLLFRGFALDLFCAEPENWGVILLLRTGPSEFNQPLVTKLSAGGWLPRGYFFRDGRIWKLPPPYDASLVEFAKWVPTPEEDDVFRVLGYQYLAPEERGAQRPPARATVPA